MATSLTLVVNPGSASRKYALYSEGYEWAHILFEFVDGKVVGKIDHAGQQESKSYDDSDLNNVCGYVLPLLREHQVISQSDTFSVIGIRLVAPSDYFVKDELFTPLVEDLLKKVQLAAPLHVTTILSEMEHLKVTYPGVPVVAVSDSAFHNTKHSWAWDYGIDIDLANKFNIKRFGYHGISVGSVSRLMEDKGILPAKAIICHLGSGSSVTAVVNGRSVDTTMGYTPLEGLVMASRSGSMDISAALAIKRVLNLTDDGLEQYLNKQSGLLGVSGRSNDIRQLIDYETAGDKRAAMALRLYVYRVQLAIGQMAASMDGVDGLIFTATVAERSKIIRRRIMDGLDYLGLKYDPELNESTFEPLEPTNIAIQSSKPIYVVSTKEAAEIARRAEQYIRG